MRRAATPVPEAAPTAHDSFLSPGAAGRPVRRPVRRLARRLTRRRTTLPALALALAALLTLTGQVAAWGADAYVPASEREVVSRVNVARAAAHLPALRVEGRLTRVARWRSRDMAVRGYFSHQIPPTSVRVMDVLRDRGYCTRSVGEAIGWNNESPAVATARMLRMWMDSPPHRAILLGKQYVRIGVGAYRTSDARTMWTLIVVRPCT